MFTNYEYNWLPGHHRRLGFLLPLQYHVYHVNYFQKSQPWDLNPARWENGETIYPSSHPHHMVLLSTKRNVKQFIKKLFKYITFILNLDHVLFKYIKKYINSPWAFKIATQSKTIFLIIITKGLTKIIKIISFVKLKL